MEKVIFQDLGSVDYQQAWDYQQGLLQELVTRKRANRHSDGPPQTQQHYLLFCEHPPVYTLGKSGSMDHLLLDEQQLGQKGIDFYKINRGGDITFHGEGQVVGYPIFDLDEFFTDVHKYVRYLEEVIIRMLADFGITGARSEGFTGVWIPADEKGPNRKLCAIGVHLSRWVTMHGFALNVNTDLKYFDYIVPCGINDPDKIVTSMKQELEETMDIQLVKERLKKHFADLFGFVFVDTPESQIKI